MQVFIYCKYTLHVSGVTVKVSCAPDDGCDGHPKHVEYICSK